MEETRYIDNDEKEKRHNKFEIMKIETDNIVISDDYENFDVYVVLSDASLQNLLLRSNLYEKSGYTDFQQILDSSAIVNTYLVADKNDVSVWLVLDDSENGKDRYFEVDFRLQPKEGEFALMKAEHDDICTKLKKSLGMTPAEALQKWAAEENDDPDYYEQQRLAEKETQEQLKKMNQTMRNLGIDVETICKAIQKAEDIISCDAVNYDCKQFHEEAKFHIEHRLGEHKLGAAGYCKFLTNEIISSYYYAVKFILEDCAYNKGLRGKIDFNCHVNVDINNINSSYYYIEGVANGTKQILHSGEDTDEFFEEAIKRNFKNYKDKMFKDALDIVGIDPIEAQQKLAAEGNEPEDTEEDEMEV